MATHTSTVNPYDGFLIRRVRGIGGATPDLPKPEKKDCKDTKALADLSKPAKHLESEEVEASSLNRKSSQQHLESEEVGTKTTKWAKTSNIFGWDHDHVKCMEMNHELSDYDDDDDYYFDGDIWSFYGPAYSLEIIKPEIDFSEREEPKIVPPLRPVSPPTSDFDECTLESNGRSYFDSLESEL